MFFLFLPLSVSLNPSTRAEERERRKEKSFALRCCSSCWDFIKSCLRSHLCLVDVLILEQIVKFLINLNQGHSRNLICGASYQNNVNFSC